MIYIALKRSLFRKGKGGCILVDNCHVNSYVKAVKIIIKKQICWIRYTNAIRLLYSFTIKEQGKYDIKHKLSTEHNNNE